MEALDSNAIHLELKYCERCGWLSLRLRDSDLVFCPPCALAMSGLSRDPRFRSDVSRGTARDRDTHVAFWTEGGNA
jgi:hypothetical protein